MISEQINSECKKQNSVKTKCEWLNFINFESIALLIKVKSDVQII